MKLPVFKAVGMTFAFVISNWLEILKIVWLPTVLMTVASALAMPAYMEAMAGFAQGAQPSPEEAARAAGTILPIAFGLMLLSAAYYMIVFAGILKLVIRGEKPGLPFYLGFGADEWRLLATWVLLFLIFIGVNIVFNIVVFAAVSFGAGAGPILVGILMLVVLVGFIWLCLRLSLATPATVGASTIGIGPSWNAAKGNVWRLLLYWLIWAIIFLVFSAALISLLMPDYFAQMSRLMSATSSGSQEEVEAASNAMMASYTSMYDFATPAGLARYAIGFVLGVVAMAFWVTSGGVAWRLMTDDQPEKHFE